MIAYKLLRPGRIAPFGGAAWPAPGEWLEVARVEPCRSGLHACRAEDLPYWLGLGELWEVELEEVGFENRKLAARLGRLVRPIERWNEATQRAFVASCVERLRPLAADEPRFEAFLQDVESSSPQGAAFIAARAAELHGGPAAYEAERRAQAAWLIETLELATRG
jgi:hypothetical protein